MSEWVTDGFQMFWVVDSIVVADVDGIFVDVVLTYYCWYYCCCCWCCCDLLMSLWPVHLCEDLLCSAVTIGAKHLVHSLNNPENIKLWIMKINIWYENVKASCTLPQQPWKYFHYVGGIILSSDIHPWHQHIIDCLCVSPSISSLSWSSSTHNQLHESIKVSRFHLLTINGAVPIDIVHSKCPAQFFLRVSYQL